MRTLPLRAYLVFDNIKASHAILSSLPPLRKAKRDKFSQLVKARDSAGHTLLACHAVVWRRRVTSDPIRTFKSYFCLPPFSVTLAYQLASFQRFLGEQRNVKRLHLTCFEFDFHNFRASSVVEFNPVAHVRGQQHLAERGNPTDGVSSEIEFVDADDS